MCARAPNRSLVTADGSDLRLILTRENGGPVEVRFGSAVGDTDQFDKLVLLEARLEDLDDPTVSSHRRLDRLTVNRTVNA